MSDCVSFIILICALAWMMTYSFNKVGYDFTEVDTLLLCLSGILVFIIPVGVIRLIAWMI